CAAHIWCWPTSDVTKALPPVTSHSFWTTNCGLIKVSEFSYARHCLPRQVLICSHHLASAVLLGGVSAAPCAYMAFISCSTSFTLPTMGTSTRTRFEIDEGS